jgi:hypothetical protein
MKKKREEEDFFTTEAGNQGTGNFGGLEPALKR